MIETSMPSLNCNVSPPLVFTSSPDFVAPRIEQSWDLLGSLDEWCSRSMHDDTAAI